MVIVALSLTILGAASLGFGCWGRFTEAGRSQYDEMAGMVPYAAFYAGILVLVIALVCWSIALLRWTHSPTE